MADQHPFANRPYVTWGALRDELFVVTADGYGPEVEGMLSCHVSTLGHPAKVSIHQVGRENLMNRVGMGFGLTLASASTLGVVYRGVKFVPVVDDHRSEEHTSELQSLMRISYAVCCLKKKK